MRLDCSVPAVSLVTTAGARDRRTRRRSWFSGMMERAEHDLVFRDFNHLCCLFYKCYFVRGVLSRDKSAKPSISHNTQNSGRLSSSISESIRPTPLAFLHDAREEEDNRCVLSLLSIVDVVRISLSECGGRRSRAGQFLSEDCKQQTRTSKRARCLIKNHKSSRQPLGGKTSVLRKMNADHKAQITECMPSISTPEPNVK